MAKHITRLLCCGICCFIALSVVAEEYLEIPLVFTKAPKWAASSSDNHQKTIINATEIQQSGASNIAQILNGQAGLQVYDLNGDYSQMIISMHGFGDNAASNSLILLDGQPLKNPDINVPELNIISLSQIAAIEVIPGSRGVEYGDQAVGGVVNIITYKPKPHDFRLAVNSGSYNQYGINTALSDSYDNGFSLLLQAFKKHTDNYRRHNDSDQTNLAGQLRYDYDNGVIKFNYRFIDNNQWLAGGLTAEQIAQDRQQAINNNDFVQQKTQLFDLGLTQNLAAGWQLDTHARYRFTNGYGVIGNPFVQQRKVADFLPRIKGKVGNVHLTTGVDLENDSYQMEGSSSNGQADQQEQSIFARAVYPINNKLYLTGGSRFANLTGNLSSQNGRLAVGGHAFVNELGVSYRFTPAIEFFLRRDGNYRFPKADENLNTPAGINGLATQTGLSYETGLTVHTASLNGNFMLYQLRLNNEIAFDPNVTPAQPFGANRNLAPTLRNGATLALAYSLNENIKINGQYSYVDAKFSEGENAGKKIPFVASNIFRMGADYGFAKDWNLYAEGLYTGSRYASNDDKNQAGLLGGYTVYNINLSRRIKALTISARINNVFNKIYNTYTIYMPATDSSIYYPAPERNFLLTFEYAIS